MMLHWREFLHHYLPAGTPGLRRHWRAGRC